MEKYYHGSPDDNVTEILRSTPERQFVFYGMFFGDWDVAKSHAAPHIYSVEVDRDNLIEAFRFAYDDDAYDSIKENFGEPLEDEELFHDLISHHASLWDTEISEEDKEKLNNVFGKVLGYYPGTETYELDWAFQSASAFIAEKLGYEGVWVPDEHGTSLIVTPGHKLHKEI
jgi:hypothetical protein